MTASQPKKSSFGIRKSIHAVKIVNEEVQKSPDALKGPLLRVDASKPVLASLMQN